MQCCMCKGLGGGVVSDATYEGEGVRKKEEARTEMGNGSMEK